MTPYILSIFPFFQGCRDRTQFANFLRNSHVVVFRICCRQMSVFSGNCPGALKEDRRERRVAIRRHGCDRDILSLGIWKGCQVGTDMNFESEPL